MRAVAKSLCRSSTIIRPPLKRLPSPSSASSVARSLLKKMTTIPAPGANIPSNPVLHRPWANQPFGLPPLLQMRAEHFTPAFEQTMAEHLAEIDAIAADTTEPTFESVVAPLDRAGWALDDVSRCFSTLCSSATYAELQAVEMAMAPRLAKHATDIYANSKLFSRLDAVHAGRLNAQPALTPEQLRCVERLHLDFVRAGARFDVSAKAEYARLVSRLAELQTQFSQNLLADETDFTLDLALADLAGCPADVVAAARQAAVDRKRADDVYVITLSRSSVEPFLTFASRRDLRERAWRAWTQRGEMTPGRDNRVVLAEILRLRAEQAKMHGYTSFGHYQLADTMSGSPESVKGLLETVWPKARRAAELEREALAAWAVAHGELEQGGSIEPYDWRYFAEKVRVERFAFDDAELKPYLSLDAMTRAVFDCAKQLFGLAFVPRPDLQGFHEDAKVYEVQEGPEGRAIALFIADNFARVNKQGGAWMSELRTQSKNGGEVLPLITNNNNFSKGSPALLSFDDAVTLFHEFGHGMHGTLSNVTYKTLAGTSVLRDFVELPSQLFEHFLSAPEVLKKHALHVETGQPMPEELLAKLKAARTYNAGFDVIEYTASALLDQALHALPAAQLEALDVNAFERETLGALGMPAGIVPRHRPAHFSHLFSGSSYASAYFCYLYAEVLDADAFDAFKQAGVFDKETAARVRKYIYSSGNSLEPAAAFRAFRGRDPVVEPMLRKKGLLA